MYDNKIPEKTAFPTNEHQAARYLHGISEPVEDRQTVMHRVSGTFYQASELSEEICQIAEMLLGPFPPANLASNPKGALTPAAGILSNIDEASEDTRLQMERAFAAIKRLRAAF